jgi:succinate-semialdehyde dehydrogenase/glutarate-semialdehyde dehydrogenase
VRHFFEVDSQRGESGIRVGLAAYAWTKSAKTANLIGSVVESGMVSINNVGLTLPEVPFGGVKDSGYGSKCGSEALDAYMNNKFISQAGL